MKKTTTTRNFFALIMKVTGVPTLLVLLLAGMAYGRTGLAQEMLNRPVTVEADRRELRVVLNQLEKSARVRFSYVPALIRDHKVSVAAHNQRLSEVLEKLLRPLRIQYSVAGGYIILNRETDPAGLNNPSASPEGNEYAQISQKISVPVEETISGKVTGENNEVLPGVSVVLKGTTRGTTTDAEGQYRLTVPDRKAVLVFSFVGFTSQEITIGNQSIIHVTLQPDTKSLNEIVVVGYGTQKKVNVTGAISMVDGKNLKQAPTTHVTNTLAGRVAGVIAVNRSGEPGSEGSDLFIRGRSTLGDNSPLIVVDGIPSLLGGLDKLDPNDIESVSVLKDASASIYGSRAANGVILVKTKRGKTGKPTIDYSFNQGFVSPTRLPEMADAALYAQLVNEIQEYAGGQPRFTADDITKFRDGSSPWTHPNTNWVDAVIKPTSLQNRQNLSLRGGSDKVRYFVSLGTLFEDAVYRNSATNYKQQNLRINLDADVNEYVRLTFDVQGRHSNKNYPPVSASSIFRFLLRGRPTETAVWPNGLPGPDIEQGNNPVVTSTNTSGYNRHDINLGNIIFGFNIKIPGVDGLSVDGNLAASKELTHKKNFIKPWTLYTFGGFDSQNNPILNGAERGVVKPQLTETFVHEQQVTFNAKINYNRAFGLHNLSTFVAYEQNEQKGNDFYGLRKFFISPIVDQLFAGGQDEREVSGKAFEAARRNYFGRVSYQYNDKYLFDFNWRYDGSQNFPSDRRFGFFPGFSAGWVISNEGFWKNNVNTVSFLKMRGSWGQMGNDKVSSYQYLSIYGFDSGTIPGAIFGNNLSLNSAIYPVRIPNPNITWEVANTFNFGLESHFLNGALTVEADYFNTKRSNILIPRTASVPDYTGMVLPDENLGKVRNRGFDAQISYRKTFGKVKFDLAGTVSYSRNKILFWDESPNVPDYQRYTGSTIGSKLYYDAIGVFKDIDQVNSTPRVSGARPGDVIFRDVNSDGKIDALDQIRVNQSEFPNLTYGLNLGVQYGGFDLNMLWQGAGDANQYVRTESGLIGNFPREYVENRWTKENPSATVPRVFDNREYWITQQNTYWLYNTNYLRLKTLQIGYTIPATFTQKLKVQNLRFYVSGQNLLTIDKVKLFDPEVPNGSGQYYPQIKILNAGVSLSF
ncbi:SusC/RagA family TonB-linked outer membrane protein [Larkinella sp. GY13]|uniref:SusC/RagA family TonB-linked outer membrane protein n=1 Tax=Larkinella sp. GY13 TaxID=3453720 RepID=UPI003EEFB832